MKRAIKAPPDLVRALQANPPAWDRWGALSPSHQREHVEAIEEAKKPETRARRIEWAVQKVAAPKVAAPKVAAPKRAAPAASEPATRYALLIRGVNVGTKNSLPMADLRSMLSKLGCADVQTYVQSGNAVFAMKQREAAFTKAIEDALSTKMGRPIATTLRTLAQLKAVVDANPWSELASDPKRLCVTFLSHSPTAAELAPLHAQDWAPERLAIAGSEIYTWHPDGQARSPLAAALGKLRLRGAVTTRNWNTVGKLLEMLGEA